MKYLLSIVCTIFSVLLGIAFYMETQQITPPTAQYVIFFFMLVALVWLWAADLKQMDFIAREQARGGQSLSHRVIWTTTIFPFIAWLFTAVIAVVYFAAFNWMNNLQTAGMRHWLPNGLWIPAFVFLIVFALLAAIQLFNGRANEDTARQQANHDADVSIFDRFRGDVGMLSSRVDPSNAEQVKLMQQIEAKASSLPLHINPATAPFIQQAETLIQTNAASGQAPTTQELTAIQAALSRVR